MAKTTEIAQECGDADSKIGRNLNVNQEFKAAALPAEVDAPVMKATEMAKTSEIVQEVGDAEAKIGRKMNVNQDSKAALPAKVDAPVPKIQKNQKIRIYMMLATRIVAVLWIYTTLLYIALPFAISDSCAREELRRILSLVNRIMEGFIVSLVLGACLLLEGNTN